MRRLEPGQALTILGERLREDLDRDLPTQIGIGGFERAVKEFGLPGAIRTDNGLPCALVLLVFASDFTRRATRAGRVTL